MAGPGRRDRPPRPRAMHFAGHRLGLAGAVIAAALAGGEASRGAVAPIAAARSERLEHGIGARFARSRSSPGSA